MKMPTAPAAPEQMPPEPDGQTTAAHLERPDGTPLSLNDATFQPSAPPSTRRRRLVWIVPILLVVGAVAVLLGTKFWYESTHFVMTDNAQVMGSLIQVGSLNAGRIVQANLDVGQTVQKDQVIAVVSVPQQVSGVPMTDQPLLQQTGSTNAEAPVRSPISGVIAAHIGSVGSTVSAGEAIYALIDPQRIWVTANIDEDKVSRIRVGQPVDIDSVALGQTLHGRVEAVTPASAGTFSLLPAQNLSGNFNHVTQWVPVKIAIDSDAPLLPLGTSVSVQIHVAEDSGIPWLP